MEPKSRWLAQIIGLDHTIITRPGDWSVEEVEEYNEDIVQQFIDDMTRAGFKVQPYEGRCGYKGVAIVTDERSEKLTYQNAIRATELKLNTDQCALDKVVYPALMQWTPTEQRAARDIARELEGQTREVEDGR